jgi:hypothetical protein
MTTTTVKTDFRRQRVSQIMKSKTITVSINAAPASVYAFASNPANLPQWIPSFVRSVAVVNGEWVVQTPNGPMTWRFVPKNEFGVLDHYLKSESDLEIYNPMRVIPNGPGSEVVFTLFRTPNMSEEEHAQDAKAVENDLRVLKGVIESSHV